MLMPINDTRIKLAYRHADQLIQIIVNQLLGQEIRLLNYLELNMFGKILHSDVELSQSLKKYLKIKNLAQQIADLHQGPMDS